MDFKKLEAQFRAFIEKEQKSDPAGKKKILEKEDASIFGNHDNVNKFIDKQYGFNADDMTMSLKTLLDMDVKDGQFVNIGAFDVDDIELEEGEEAEENKATSEVEGLSDEAKNNIGASMVEVINDILKDKEVQKVVDEDGDGEITKSEIKTFLETTAGIDGKSEDISLEDILSKVDSVKNPQETEEVDEVEEDEEVDEVEEDEEDDDISVDDDDYDDSDVSDVVQPDQPASTGGTTGGGGVSGGGGGSSVGGSSGGGYSPTVSNSSNPDSLKTLDNMNADELQAELETKKEELSTKQSELDKASSGDTPELKELQDKIDDAYEKYQEAVKDVDEELAQKLDDKKKEIDDKKQEISDKEAEITENEGKVSEAETAVSNAESKVSSLESAISSISGSLSSDISDEQKASLEAKKSELEAQLTEAKAEVEKAKEQLEEAKETLKTSKEEKETLDGELETLNGEMEEIEAEILEAKPEIEEYMNEYKEAQEAFDTKKADAISKAQEAVKVAQDEVNEIQNKLTEVQNKAIEAAAKLSSLAGSYNYNGSNYNCVMDQAELDKLVQQAAAGGAGTKFGKADKCLSIAETYGAWMTGDSNTSCANSGGYLDADKYSVFNTENKDELLATVKEELDAGRPCVLHVNGAGTGRHYVTVVGYKDTAGSTLQESDLLIWDSYACTIGSCPDDRHMITGWSTGRTGSEGYGWQVYKRKS